MHIIVVIGNAELGGAQKVAINLAQWIKSNTSSTVHIVALTDTEHKTYDMQELNFSVIDSGNTIKELRNLIKTEKPDIVLTMGTPLSIYTVPACAGINVKHIISERNDPAHFAGKKIVKIVSRLLMKTASAFVFQTKDAQFYYGSRIAKKSKVIPNPLFNTESMPKEPFNGVRTKSIVSVGRLNKQKNQSLLIEAFAEISDMYPDFKLVIWGEGPEKQNLELLINNLGIGKKIRLAGVSRNVLSEIYKDSLFVLSSDFEGMPNALMEAMALGLPCISTDCPCGGPNALIKNMENGILIPVNDKKDLTEKIKFMLDNPDTAEELGKEAFKIRDSYNINHISNVWYNFFEEVLYGKK